MSSGQVRLNRRTPTAHAGRTPAVAAAVGFVGIAFAWVRAVLPRLSGAAARAS